MIRLATPFIDEKEHQAVRKVLESGFLVQGEEVARFERKVAQYVGTRHAVAVSSCTAALHLSLVAAGVKPGDKVAVAAYSWIASANVIELCGAEPVFVDIQPDTFNLDPGELGKTLQKEAQTGIAPKRVKALIPVHTFGRMADMEAIGRIADAGDLTLIEDAACALGAEQNGRQAGTWGRAGCFSFHPRKNITTGEGGVVTTDDDHLAAQIRVLRNHGFDPECDQPDFILPGFNYRMTEFQAALGIEQMKKIDQIIAKRRDLAAHYDSLLEDTPFQYPLNAAVSRPVCQSYVILLPSAIAAKRNELIDTLRQQGIETTVGTLHMPLTEYYSKKYGFRKGDFPVTDDVAARSMTLPLYVGMEKKAQKRIVEKLLEFL